MGLVWVDPKFLDTVWPVASDFLAKSVAACPYGDSTLEQLRLQIVRGDIELLVYEQDGQVIGAAAVELNSYPQRRVAFIQHLGGRGIVDRRIFQELKDWAQRQGALTIRAACDAARARLYRRVGLNLLYQVVGG